MKYLNISDTFPLNPYMKAEKGTYLFGENNYHGISIPVEINKALTLDDILCDKDHMVINPTKYCEIPWKDNSGNIHTDIIFPNKGWIVNSKSISDEPKYPLLSTYQKDTPLAEQEESDYEQIE